MVLVHEPVPAMAPAMHRTRTTVVHAGHELVSVLGDAMAPLYRVTAAEPIITTIADGRPEVLIVGPFDGDGESLSQWDVVALARAHRALRAVPIILLTCDLDAWLTDGRRLGAFANVHVLGMPFDVDVLDRVLASATRGTRSSSHASALAAAGRLPLLCSHGYSADPDAGQDGCAQCAAYGVMGGQ